ncbi:MAG: squalene/phytoene synthase family protein, partial [Thauera sp.]|nr:squalene/phytoene synthase family protein [Thauera sp.]
VAVDWEKRRIYLPLDDLARFGLDEPALDALARGERSPGEDWRALMAFEVQRARTMMLDGAPLARALPGRVGWELRLVVLGGLRILERIEAVGYDVFRHRPALGRGDWARLGWRALNYGKLG